MFGFADDDVGTLGGDQAYRDRPNSAIQRTARFRGRWFERAADGSECDWGRVLVYAPPTQLTLAWHLNGAYAYDADPAKASRVDVTFHDEGGGKTRVDLVHTQLERHALGWEKVRDSVGSGGGWPLILGRYAASFTSP